jgi:hypothetical protein
VRDRNGKLVVGNRKAALERRNSETLASGEKNKKLSGERTKSFLMPRRPCAWQTQPLLSAEERRFTKLRAAASGGWQISMLFCSHTAPTVIRLVVPLFDADWETA